MHRASIGDTLLATPVYRAIKECYPAVYTVAITSYTGYELLKGNPYIDELIPYDKGDSVFAIIRRIWRSDVALILDHHYRNALYAFLAMIPKRIGRGKDFINVPVKDEFLTEFEPLKYIHIAEQVGIMTPDLSLTKPVATMAEKRHVQQICREINKDNRKMILLVPYSLSKIKDWEPEKYREIIKRLQDRGCVVVVIGGQDQQVKIAEEYPMVVNLAGRTNLRETTELIARADLQICGCTAMLHVCSTTDTPAIAIYGPTTPSQWAPKKNCTVITHSYACSPCYNVGDKNCRDNKCIQDIGVDEVWGKICIGGWL